jgi:hypothetical protein
VPDEAALYLLVGSAKGGGGMNKSLIGLVLAILLAAALGASPATDAKAGAAMAASVASGLTHQPLVTPVRVWRDCQRIARCNGCQPVFHCRSCEYQRRCPPRQPCQWADICTWGPFLPVAPRGVRVY